MSGVVGVGVEDVGAGESRGSELRIADVSRIEQRSQSMVRW
jgi:hypothetical protein